MANRGGRTGWLSRLGAAHDALTRFSFGLSALLLAVIVCSYCYEIVSRYVFNAPTSWASPLVSYALAAMIFLAMPQLTRLASHISINVLTDSAPPPLAAVLRVLVRVLAAAACLFAAWFCADETLRQYSQDIWTSPPFALPKWTISIFVPYGMLSSGLYFLRQLWADAPLPVGAGDPL
jgi:C4-dicarboxylate transporter DctQ subunit